MVDHKSSKQGSTQSPRFSAGLVTGIITAVFLIAFGAIMLHGMQGVHQHDSLTASQSE